MTDPTFTTVPYKGPVTLGGKTPNILLPLFNDADAPTIRGHANAENIALDSNFGALSAGLADLDAYVAQVHDQVCLNTANLQNLQNLFNTLSQIPSQVDDLTTQVGDLASTVSSQSQEVADLDTQVSNLQTDLNTQVSNLTANFTQTSFPLTFDGPVVTSGSRPLMIYDAHAGTGISYVTTTPVVDSSVTVSMYVDLRFNAFNLVWQGTPLQVADPSTTLLRIGTIPTQPGHAPTAYVIPATYHTGYHAHTAWYTGWIIYTTVSDNLTISSAGIPSDSRAHDYVDGVDMIVPVTSNTFYIFFPEMPANTTLTYGDLITASTSSFRTPVNTTGS